MQACEISIWDDQAGGFDCCPSEISPITPVVDNAVLFSVALPTATSRLNTSLTQLLNPGGYLVTFSDISSGGQSVMPCGAEVYQ